MNVKLYGSLGLDLFGISEGRHERSFYCHLSTVKTNCSYLHQYILFAFEFVYIVHAYEKKGLYRTKNYLQFQAAHIFVQEIYQYP